jgi:hypothetical protein
MNKSKSFAVAAGVAGAIALATTASAAPVTSGTLALKNAGPTDVVQVRSRGWRRAGVAAGIGFAAGTLIGAAASAGAYGYYGGPYAYDYYGGPYAYDYDYAPAYSYGYGPGWGYAPAYSYGYAPGPGIYAGPRSYRYYTNQPANPTLGTTYGASVTD